MTSPYDDLPPDAFWRNAVSDRAPLDPAGIYAPRFRITKKTRIFTAGSCFAQHLNRNLRDAGYHVLDAEPLHSALPDDIAARFGYRQFSARMGNIYTLRHMVQLVRECLGEATPSDPVWEKDGRFFDAQRPSVEPQGLPSADDVLAHRAQHLHALRETLPHIDLFVFTMGLTEAWIARSDETIYPTAPGVIAGSYDPETMIFKNFTAAEVLADALALRELLRRENPKMRMLLTVSPVPLTATASGQHVEVATAYSKATLRSVCGRLTQTFRNVDYFPSYEIITSPATRGAYFAPNLRNVSDAGVAAVMSVFRAAHGDAAKADPAFARGRVLKPGALSMAKLEEASCDDALLEAFSP
ncbi:GSCFA domain-containing protein [Primorskyibacter sp. S187A]|uniref:GSCFA domain-containing protein n=1 Tax=Primorskyibacter sp. S187A TaxID=3415130 RepID=UPI003C7EAAAA